MLNIIEGRRLLFLGGKGGTGKTTLASAIAVGMARRGVRVLLVSTDPAHNLAHIFAMPIGDVPTPICEHLEAVELDPDTTVTEHLKQTRSFLRRLMPERLRDQIDRHLEQSRQAPGMVEAALLESLAVLIEEESQRFDLIVVDTAPSGHTARLMDLPELMAAWTEGLIDSRERSRQFTLSANALGGQQESSTKVERDQQIRAVLFRRRQRFTSLRHALSDQQKTAFIIVLIAERLPVLETVELHAQLMDSKVCVPLLIVNKRTPAGQGEWAAQLHEREQQYITQLCGALPEVPQRVVDRQADEVVGLNALESLGKRLLS